MYRKKAVQRAVSLLLALVMCFSLLPAGALASGEGSETGYPVSENSLARAEPIKLEAENGILLDGTNPASGKSATLDIKSGGGTCSGSVVENFYDQGVGCGVQFNTPVAEEGDYEVWMHYAKGSMYSPCTLSLFVNDEKVDDKFHLATTANTSTPVDSNSITVHLTPGDNVTVKRDVSDGDKTLCRFDYLGLALIEAPDTREPIQIELENGTKNDEAGTATVVYIDGPNKIKNGIETKPEAGFSGTGYINQLNNGGIDSQVVINPEITAETAGEYLVTICYAKSNSYAEFEFPLYHGETKVGAFQIKKTGGNGAAYRVTSDPITVTLAAGDKISLRVEKEPFAQGTDFLAAFDYILLTPSKNGVPVGPKEFAVTATVNNSSYGGITLTNPSTNEVVESGAVVPADTELLVDAVAVPGYTLKRIDVTVGSTTTTIKSGDTITVTGETAVHAVFAEWGGKFEAEDGKLLEGAYVNETKKPVIKSIRPTNTSSSITVVTGFIEGMGETAKRYAGSGVTFDKLDIPKADTYELRVSYVRGGDYDQIAKPSLYVNSDHKGLLDLSGTTNTTTRYDTEVMYLDLEPGDTITIKLDELSNVNGEFDLDGITLLPKTEEVGPDTSARFENDVVMVVTGSKFTIPTLNVSGGTTLTYTSKQADVATVDEDGVITAVAVGSATITATMEDGASFAATVKVVADDSALTLEELAKNQIKKEAENGVLLSGETKALKITTSTNGAYSGNKFVENFWDEGPGCGVRFDNVVEESGYYKVWMQYNKGVSYSPCTLTFYVGDNRTGKFHMADTANNFASTVSTNYIIVRLEKGQNVTVKRDGDDSPLCRFDYLGLERVTGVPASSFEVADMALQETEIKPADITTVPTAANDVLDWSSSDETVATVNNGTVFAGKPGEAEITVSSRYFDFNTTFTVTVTENDKLTTIESGDLSVMLDRTFPRVVKYELPSGKTMDGSFTPISTMLVNKQQVTPEVTYTPIDASSGKYDLKLTAPNATIHMLAKVEGNVFKLDVTGITEAEGDANRVFSLEIPGQNLVSVSSRDEGAELAGANLITDVTKSGDTFLDLNAVEFADAKPVSYAYVFLTNGKVAAGLAGNGMLADDNSSSIGNDHFIKQTVAEGDSYRTGISSNTWIYRHTDYEKKFQDLRDKYPEQQVKEGDNEKIVNMVYKSEPEVQKPYIWVVITEECNGDEVLNWQDAAYAFRPIRNHVFDEEKVPDLVVQRLIMQQAGVGNYPFTAVLDETKRMSLNTDNLGQLILDKFHNEGFWGDFTHYDDHLGGWRDFNYMVDEATENYNGYVGVHSNFTEYFAKAEQFSTELTSKLKPDGTWAENNGYKSFGAFLQQAYTIDDIADSLSGDREQRLTQFKLDVPNLGFVYSDVWSKGNWRGRAAGEDYRQAGIGYLVEWPYINFEDAIWAHWGIEQGYGGKNLKGITSDILRFVFNDSRDRWDGDAFPDEPGRVANARNLLIGADTTNYEGWWNNGRTNQHDRVLFQIYDNNLPTKFMQHFPIMSMEKTAEGWAKNIVFENGVEAFYEGNDPKNRTITVDGKVVYENHTYLLPWDDGHLSEKNPGYEGSIEDYRPGENDDLAAQRVTLTTNPDKLYFWNSVSKTDETVKPIADTTWELLSGWAGLSRVYLYELTDLGRVNEREIPVVDGKITLTGMKSATPYVIFKTAQSTSEEQVEEIGYGDGGYVTDPGFSSGSVDTAWTLDKGQAEVKKNYSVGDSSVNASRYKNLNRDYELIMEGADASQVSQVITGLTPGESYAATVMVEVQQDRERRAMLMVDCGGITQMNYTDKSILVNSNSYDSKADTYMLRMRVQFTVPQGVTSATIRLGAVADGSETPAIVRFDNVRVFEATVKEDSAYVSEHSDGSEITGKVIVYQDYENTLRNPALIQGDTDDQKARDALKPEFEAYAPLLFGPAQLSNINSAERRSSISSRNEPYTQNGLEGSQWDKDSLDVDDVLMGERSLRIYNSPNGVAFQTIPQSVRFEEGHTYKVSFLYQYRKDADGDFKFVVGEGKIPLTNTDSHNPAVANVKKTVALPSTSPAISEETRYGRFVYEFTSADNQTWVGIAKVANKGDNESPAPFQLDNFLVEDITEGLDEECTVYVNVSDPLGGTLTVTKDDGSAVNEGDCVAKDSVLTVSATANTGYTLKGVTVNGAALVGGTVTITADTTIHAEFLSNKPEPTPTPSTPGSSNTTTTTTTNPDGSKTTTVTNKKTGTVTETTKFTDGKAVETVTAKDGSKTIAVTGPDGKKVAELNIPAAVPAPETPFADLSESDWAKSAADFVAGMGLFTGGSGNTFAGGELMDRAMLVTVLHRLSGKVDGESTGFADVDDGAWYADAVTWAAGNGIISGNGGGFDPNGTITRETMALMLYRYTQLLGLDVTAKAGEVSAFPDGNNTSSWAADAMSWAVGNGLLSGKGGGVLDPTGSATRAEVAVILQRFVENILK